MIVERNDCCDCATENYPCLGDSCDMRHHKVHVCDNCDSTNEQLYHYEGQELCMNCIVEILESDLEPIFDY